jgi:hypothetical protein
LWRRRRDRCLRKHTRRLRRAGGRHHSGHHPGRLSRPCTLLTNAEVTQLTGHAVTRTDPDGLGTDAPTRHCQWQLESGDLAIFLTTTTESDFKVRDPAAQDVSGVGDEAYTSAGHLFVRTDQTQVDIYARSADDDATNLAVAKATFEKLLPKVR